MSTIDPLEPNRPGSRSTEGLKVGEELNVGGSDTRGKAATLGVSRDLAQGYREPISEEDRGSARTSGPRGGRTLSSSDPPEEKPG